MPNCSTLSRQKTLKVNIPDRGSQGPRPLLIDIEPVSATGSSQPAKGHQGRGRSGVERPQAWRHEAARSPLSSDQWRTRLAAQDPHPLPGRRTGHSPRGGIAGKTLEIRAAGRTIRAVGDAPMLPETPDQIPPDPAISSVTADAAFDPRKCQDAIAARGAAPERQTVASPAPPGRRAQRGPARIQNASAGRSGDDGAVPTAEAASKYEPGQKTVRRTVFPAIGCIV